MHNCFSILFLVFVLLSTNYSVGSANDAPRGYLTTPQELALIRQKAYTGLEPYTSAVEEVLDIAEDDWDYDLDTNEDCESANRPRWLDNARGVRDLYAKALAYHLDANDTYAEEVATILETIMVEVETFSLEQMRCQLVLSWGIPEIIASADLIETYWQNRECEGPLSTDYFDTTLGTGTCKVLFQNWLVKNVYYVVSLAGEEAQSNWGAAATNTMAYIADYVWDRDDVVLITRMPPELSVEGELLLTPAQAFERANTIAIDRMNGYRVEYRSNWSCDYLGGDQQNSEWSPVKSQITELGIIPEEARREESCNIPVYNGDYQNYPQLHIGNNLQQCELMLRRGSSLCFDNMDMTDIQDYAFIGADGVEVTTHLYPGRGSLERAINAVILDSNTEWRHDSALEIAFRYYMLNNRFDNVSYWFQELDRPSDCSQDVCFGTLTHGFAPGELPTLPPTTLPPIDS